MDPYILYTHVKQAISAGIDGFVVDWWGKNHFEDVSFRLLLKVVEKSFPNFKLAILYDGHYGAEYKNGAKMGAEFNYIIKSYADSPNYLKFDGRPVIMIWNAKSHKSYEWIDAYYSVADREDVAFLTDWWSYTSFSDGYTTYTNDSSGYLLNIDPTKIVSETVMPGWDNTKVVKNGVVIPRGSGGFYTQWWNKVYKNNPDFVMICSWNEWHEGSEIEPSLEYGDTYLNLTRDYAPGSFFLEIFKVFAEEVDVPSQRFCDLHFCDQTIVLIFSHVQDKIQCADLSVSQLVGEHDGDVVWSFISFINGDGLCQWIIMRYCIGDPFLAKFYFYVLFYCGFNEIGSNFFKFLNCFF
jgi:hypothetical protein